MRSAARGLVAALLLAVLPALPGAFAPHSSPAGAPGRRVDSAVGAAAQESATGPGPEARVAFAPRLGSDLSHGDDLRCSCDVGVAGRPRQCACEPADAPREALMPWEGVTAQNLGAGPTRFMVSFFGSVSADAGCDVCTYRESRCSPVVEPGETWTFSPYAGAGDPLPRSGATAAVVHSLSPLRAGSLGPEWAGWLADAGLGADATLADLACEYATTGRYGPTARAAAPARRPADGAAGRAALPASPSDSPGGACGPYLLLHAAFLEDGGLLPGTPLPIAPVRGQPMAVVVASVGAWAVGPPGIDRYDAVPLAEALPDRERPEAGWTYVAPGGCGRTMEGGNSVLAAQNPGLSCVTASVRPHRSRFGPFGEPARLTVPPGARVELDIGARWPELVQDAALVVEADGPLAVTLTRHDGTATSTWRASRQRAAPVRWLLPIGHQEQTRLPAGAARAAAEGARGWQTDIAVYNPADQPASFALRLQAEGEPARPPIELAIEGLAQLVLQPGFGLGPAGGRGWVEVGADSVPMAVAFESRRTARDLPAMVVETWGASAWAVPAGDPPAPVIGLPDLAGPAVGAAAEGAIQPGDILTGSLTTSIGIQNPLTTTVRVAVDSFGPGCGYLGSIERQLDPRQATIIDADELPGWVFGANSARVRVLEGQVAVMAATARTDWPSASPGDLPVDLATAYLGGPAPGAVPAPTVVSATIAAEPSVVALPWSEHPNAIEVRLSDAEATGRCLALVASSDSPWLIPSAHLVAVPATLTLSVQPVLLPPGPGPWVASVVLDSLQPGVTPDPLRLWVSIDAPARAGLYLPWVGDGRTASLDSIRR